MPKPGYSERLTRKEVIALFRQGKYRVDPDLGEVYGRDDTKPLYTYVGDADKDKPGHRWVRLFDQPKMRALPVSHCVWMWVTRHPIPVGFEIHHRNLDCTDDRWVNLFCLYGKDHEKLHNPKGECGDLLDDGTPF